MASLPPLQKLTADNHGPGVVVATLIFIIVTAATVVTRLLTRFKITRKLVADDYLIVISMILAIGQAAVVIIASNHGLGRHRNAIEPRSFDIYAKATYAADILLIPALALAKASVTCLILGLNPSAKVRLQCYILLGVVVAWTLCSILTNAFQCGLPEPWNINDQCINLFAVDVYNTVLNVLTDLALIFIPFVLMSTVQISTQKRWLVISLFGSRLVVVAFAIAALVVRQKAFSSSGDLTWDLVPSVIWVQGMVAVSIMTACLPSIRRFLADLQTGMMGVHISEPLALTMKSSSAADSDESRRRSSLTARLASKLRIGSMTGGEKSQTSQREQFTPGRDAQSRTVIERSESKRALRGNVILQTIDYEVKYQDADIEMSRSTQDVSVRSAHSNLSTPLDTRPPAPTWSLPGK